MTTTEATADTGRRGDDLSNELQDVFILLIVLLLVVGFVGFGAIIGYLLRRDRRREREHQELQREHQELQQEHEDLQREHEELQQELRDLTGGWRRTIDVLEESGHQTDQQNDPRQRLRLVTSILGLAALADLVRWVSRVGHPITAAVALVGVTVAGAVVLPDPADDMVPQATAPAAPRAPAPRYIMQPPTPWPSAETALPEPAAASTPAATSSTPTPTPTAATSTPRPTGAPASTTKTKTTSAPATGTSGSVVLSSGPTTTARSIAPPSVTTVVSAPALPVSGVPTPPLNTAPLCLNVLGAQAVCLGQGGSR